MKIAMLYYDGFSEFEIVLIGLLFRRHTVISVALEDREYRSEENQRFCVDQVLRDVDPSSIDLFVIPGGDPALLVGSLELQRFVAALLAAGKKVAGICGGTSILAGLGFLQGRKCTGLSSGVTPDQPSYRYFVGAHILDEHVVLDGNLITAQGQAYVEFAFELARQMRLSANEEDYLAGIRWFKNIRD